MPIRAVIFDYGMVLCAPDPNAHRSLLALTGLERETFEPLYWRDRHQYDLGTFDGRGYWHRFAEHAGLNFSPAQIEGLVENDVRMWTMTCPTMLEWVASLQRAGLATAILSNMVPEVLHAMRTRPEFAWIHGFTHLTWSCELGIAKPDPAIYIHTCEKLGVEPEEALFLDDKEENIEAARELGLEAILFTNAARLRRDLAQRNLLQELPQPGRSKNSPEDGFEVLLATL